VTRRRCSARSVPGFHVVEALDAAAELLDDYGGHEQAAGFSLSAERIPALRDALRAHAAGLDPSGLRVDLVCDDLLDPEHIGLDLALEIDRLAPFGIGNPRPRFLCEGLRLAAPPQLIKEEHLKLRLHAGDSEIEAVGWRRADLAEPLAGVESVSLVATLRTRRWGGRIRPQLEIQDLGA